jgi:hypothetical protein
MLYLERASLGDTLSGKSKSWQKLLLLTNTVYQFGPMLRRYTSRQLMMEFLAGKPSFKRLNHDHHVRQEKRNSVHSFIIL